MKPTKEQIKEFWEWCGLREIIYGESHVWYDTQDRWVYQGFEMTSPPIDLNNLFKYAVPKLRERELIFNLSVRDTTVVRIYHKSEPYSVLSTYGCKDPALALFWALWKIHEKV